MRTYTLNALLLAAIPLWLYSAVPWLERIPSDFQYHADVAAYDNFYDEQKGDYTGEKRSVTTFRYDAVGQKQNVLLVRNAFDVHTITGDKVFSVERLYGIDPVTRKHVAGVGDGARDGYLFAPRHLRKGEPYTYWHINYDGPAHMKFAGEEDLFGLHVFRYETHYEGVRIDQTENLTSLPGVGVTRGVELEPSLQVWIEPRSGHLVKYADDTIAYFYDLKTHARLHPWNHFHNSFTTESVLQHVELAMQERTKDLLLMWVFPGAAAFMAVLLFLCTFRRKNAVAIVLVGVVMVAMGATAAWLFCGSIKRMPKAGPLETIDIGVEAGILPSPVFIAEQNGYFRAHGLDVHVKEFSSGRAALTSLLHAGNLNIATVAQTPIVLNSFLRDDFTIIAGMTTTANDSKILVRKDRNITTPQGLKGKRIGVTKNTTGHYFLALFLAQNGLRMQDVTLVDLDVAALPKAIRDGKVDAISTWEPHLYSAKNTLGSNASVFESVDTYRGDFYFVTFKEWARRHPEQLKRFLTAIAEAETFITDHPQEAQAIVAERLDLNLAFVTSVWRGYSFGLFLDQAILLALEQQARWMLANGTTSKGGAPNYLDFISFEALEGVKPDAISIIR